MATPRGQSAKVWAQVYIAFFSLPRLRSRAPPFRVENTETAVKKKNIEGSRRPCPVQMDLVGSNQLTPADTPHNENAQTLAVIPNDRFLREINPSRGLLATVVAAVFLFWPEMSLTSSVLFF